jgi:hypothetical protein
MHMALLGHPNCDLVLKLNGQMKQDKRTNNDLQNTTQKAKDRTE